MSRQRILWGIMLLTMAGVLGAFAWSLLPLNPVPGIVAVPGATPPAGQAGPPPVYGNVPPFELIDQAGQPFRSEALRGQIWIADFIFTSCAGTCPQMTEKMAALQRTLPPEIQLVSVSVDPKRDSPPRLAEYARRYGADSARWHFLTGPAEAIASLAQRGFRLSVAEGTDPSEPIIHSVRFVLVDRQGTMRGYYDSTDPAALERLTRDARAL